MEFLQSGIFQKEIILFLVLLFFAFFCSFLGKFLFSSLFPKWAKKTDFHYDDIFVASFSPYIAFLLFLPLFNFALYFSPFDLPFRNVIEDVFWSIFVFFIIRGINRFVFQILEQWSSNNVLPATGLMYHFIRFSLYLICGIFILQIFGISVAPLLTALGIGGLAISLALKDTLADFFSGVYLLISRKIKVGDFIKLDSGESGKVQDITWRHTLLKEFSNNVIVLPNSKISTSALRNYDKQNSSLFVSAKLGVSYDSDLEKVKRVTEELVVQMKNEMEELDDFTPTMRFFEFGDSSINFKVFLKIKERKYKFKVLDEFIRRLHLRYQEEAIEIPFPIRTLIHKNEKM